ncbi:hypothetical protein DV737_g1965, partial [Chaetothyriales sp. CBS 132003]
MGSGLGSCAEVPTKETVIDEAAIDEAAIDEAAIDEAAIDEAAIDEAAIDEAATDEAAIDEAATDEAATDEAATDEAATDETATDETATDEATTDDTTATEEVAGALDAATEAVVELADTVNFTVTYFPYQLNPEATKEGEDKYEWYKKSKYGDSNDKMSMYVTLMSAYGQSAGINYKFGGIVANTLDAHRVVQHFQEKQGPEVADKIINSLYSQYFENEKHPSSDQTLLTATTAAGIPDSEARSFIEDRYDGLFDVKNKIQEQAHNGVDSVPYIVFEGRRRDITLIGAKEVEEYEKALAQIVKESD